MLKPAACAPRLDWALALGLLAGTCNVTMGRRSVRDLKPGDGFGEIALIYNQPRTATVTATSDCEVFMMNR